MNTLLSIANGALQYHRGRQTGASGIMGIVVALLVVFQWKHIYPVLKTWGIVDFFKRLGLVYDEPYLTGFAIFMFIFKMTIVLSVLILILLALAVLLTMIFSNEKIALYVILPIMGILMTPFLILYFLFGMIFRRKQWKEERAIALEKMEKERKLGTPIEQLLRDHSEVVPTEQAYARLNRLPTEGDREFLLGLSNENNLYIVFPRPIHFETASCNTGDLVALPVTVERFKKDKNLPKKFTDVEPEIFTMKYVPTENKSPKKEIIRKGTIASFYQTTSKDMLRMFTYGGYHLYVNQIQHEYFEEKEKILTYMKNAKNKEGFDYFVERMKMFDAPNEEIVLMMKEHEKQMSEKMVAEMDEWD